MSSSDSEKYLGDVITSNAKIDENIKMRHDKGTGICNDILSILKEVSFGVYHFEMGLLFRTSQLGYFSTQKRCSQLQINMFCYWKIVTNICYEVYLMQKWEPPLNHCSLKLRQYPSDLFSKVVE